MMKIIPCQLATTLPLHKMESGLPLPEYEEYYEAIIKDDLVTVQVLFSSSDDKEKLLNAKFDYSQIEKQCVPANDHSSKWGTQLPCCVAAASCSKGVLALMLEHQVNLGQSEKGGYNIIHIIILTAERFPEKEELLVEVYDFLCVKVARADLVELLFTEDEDGFPPLELAAERGCFKLLEAIFETKGAYLKRITAVNSLAYHWYDITDYEKVSDGMSKRRVLSPLNRFACLTKSQLGDQTVHRLMMFIASTKARRYGIRKAEIAVFGRSLPGEKDGTAMQWELYTMSYCLFPAFLLLVVVMLPFSTNRHGHLALVTDFMTLISQMLLIGEILFFLQLLPFIGPFIITIMRMSRDLLRFTVILALPIFIFSVYFLILINVKSKQGCISDYNGIGQSMYTTFMVTLNIVNFSDYDLVNPGIVYVVHVVSSLAIGLLMFNFLIAVLSNTVSEMADNMQVICLIQHQFVNMIMEFSFWPLIYRHYKRVQGKHFTCEKGRVYIIRHLHPLDSRKVVR